VYASARKSAVSQPPNVAQVNLRAKESAFLCRCMHRYTHTVKRTCIGAGYTRVAAWFRGRKSARNRVKMCKSAQRTHSSSTAREKEFLSTRVHTYVRNVHRACVYALCLLHAWMLWTRRGVHNQVQVRDATQRIRSTITSACEGITVYRPADVLCDVG